MFRASKRRVWLAVAAVAALPVIAAGCGSSNNDNSDSTSADTSSSANPNAAVAGPGGSLKVSETEYALTPTNTTVQHGPVNIDVVSRVVSMQDKPVDLTGIEFDILVALARRAGQVIPRDRLLSAAGRGDVIVSERTIDVHISHLRQKLGEPRLIKTVRGVGYVFARELTTYPGE